LLDGLNRLRTWLPSTPRNIEAVARDWLRRVPLDSKKALAVALVPRSLEELAEQITEISQHLRQQPEKPYPAAETDLRPNVRDRVFYNPYPLGRGGKTAIVFPGSCNQFAGMGRDLAAQFPAILRRQQGENQRLRDQYAPSHFWRDTIPPEATPRDMLFGQVTSGTLAADLIALLGIRTDIVFGSSLGESAGLFGVRAWTDRDLMYRRIRESTLFTSDLGPPYNAAAEHYGETDVDWVTGIIAARPDEVREHLTPGCRAYLLIVSTPNECVIGGLQDDVAQLIATIGKTFLPLTGVTLAHCEAGRPVADAYRALHTLPVKAPPGLKLISGAWGRVVNLTESNCAESITAGLLQTIDFPQVIETAYREGARIFLEAGPGNSCTRMIGLTLKNRPHMARALSIHRQDSASLVLRMLAQLIAERVGCQLGALYGGPNVCADHLPETLVEREVVVPSGRPRIPEPMPKVVPLAPELMADLPRMLPTAMPEPLPPWRADGPVVAPFLVLATRTQQSTAAAHAQFLNVQNQLMATALQTLALQAELLKKAGASNLSNPRPTAPAPPPAPPMPSFAVPVKPVPRSLSYEECMTYAVGRIGDVLGPEFAEID
ncbi:MAG: hypothetical protein ACRCZF_28410, partial [Gemmataceae bacterium]